MPLITRYKELMEDAFGIVEHDKPIPNESFLHIPAPEVQPVKEELATESESISENISDSTLKSRLANVSDEQWTQFVKLMIAAPVSSVSKSNELGMFRIKPRRLADLGIVNKLSRKKSPSGRTVWTAVFIPPLTSSKFLKSPKIQYEVFSSSMKDYDKRIKSGDITKDNDISLAGALAILHKAGPSGLKNWKNGERFPETQKTHDIVAGLF